MEESKIKDFYQNWQANLSQLADGYIYDEAKTLLPTRHMFSHFKQNLERFLVNVLDEHEKIIIMPGIRGIGKTTLLMQISKIEKFVEKSDVNFLRMLPKLEERLYLDVSRLKFAGISLKDFFNYYEKLKGFNFENISRKYLFLLDEIHYDENWALFLKTIFDRTKGHKNCLFIVTGSSAINLRMSADLSRRSSIEEIYPLNFSEYLLIKYKKLPDNNLLSRLQEIIFYSVNGKELFVSLQKISLEVDRFWVNLPPSSEREFFETGNFPFAVVMTNKIKSLELIKNVINNIIAKDVITLGKFKTQTVAKIYDLLYLLANSDLVSYEKLRESLKIERFETIDALVEILINSGLLVKVKSYGKTYGGTRKTPKILFLAPSLRTAILDNNYSAGVEGKKIEDYFALIYEKDIRTSQKFGPVNLSYDIAEAGADFILTLKDKSKIIIEVGFNKENIRQVKTTSKKIKAKYGIVFGSQNIDLVEDFIVRIPLKYLLLI